MCKVCEEEESMVSFRNYEKANVTIVQRVMRVDIQAPDHSICQEEEKAHRKRNLTIK